MTEFYLRRSGSLLWIPLSIARLAALGHKASALVYLDKALALDPSYGPAIQNRRGIDTMIEGTPLDLGILAETEYYAEAFEANKRPKVGWWRKLTSWREKEATPPQ